MKSRLKTDQRGVITYQNADLKKIEFEKWVTKIRQYVVGEQISDKIFTLLYRSNNNIIPVQWLSLLSLSKIFTPNFLKFFFSQVLCCFPVRKKKPRSGPLNDVSSENKILDILKRYIRRRRRSFVVAFILLSALCAEQEVYGGFNLNFPGRKFYKPHCVINALIYCRVQFRRN